MKSPIVLLSALLDDFRRLEPDVRHLDRDLKTIEARFEHEGYGFLTVTLPSMCDALDQGLKHGRFACPTSFKRKPGEALPRFLSGLLCNVFDSKTGLLKDNPSIGSLKCLREILRLFKKLPLSGEREELLDRAAKGSFRQCDESIANVNYNARHVHHMAGVCRLILNQLEGADYEKLNYKHGPGAVFERLTPNQKWYGVSRALGTSFQGLWDPLQDLYLHNYSLGELGQDDCHEFHRKSEREGWVRSNGRRENTKSYLRPIPVDFGDVNGERQFSIHAIRGQKEKAWEGLISGRRSRLVSVAKTSTARRTITVEPCLRQFAQQGLNELLRDNILRCSVLKNSLDLTDQSINQKLALEGSRTGIWATIDLSSASDLLSLRLVKLVFGSKPIFLDRLVESRSAEVDDGKTVYDLQKYAGMGNATTFPVQSVVFAVVAMAAILDACGLKPTMAALRRASRLVRVYGDDIIVPSLYSRQVVTWIESFGLRVNHQKSFMEPTDGRPCFRESCGVDAYGGFDITPLYLRTDPKCGPSKGSILTSAEPGAIAGLVSTSNLAWERGLYKASATLSEHVEDLLKRKLPLVPKRSSALGWHSRVDSCNPTKWDPVLQRLVIRAPVLRPVYRPDPLDGYAALLKAYHVPLLGRGPRHLERTQRRFASKLQWKWIPAECWAS